MKKTLLTVFALTIMVSALLPFMVFADHNPIKGNVFDPGNTLAGPLLLCSGTAGTPGLPPCKNLCDLVAQIANIIYFVIAVVIWIITPILVTIGGIMIMLGGTSPERIQSGKKTITGAVWGVAIVLCAWLIVFTFVGAFGNLGKYIGGFGGSNGTAACQT